MIVHFKTIKTIHKADDLWELGIVTKEEVEKVFKENLKSYTSLSNTLSNTRKNFTEYFIIEYILGKLKDRIFMVIPNTHNNVDEFDVYELEKWLQFGQ